MIKRLLAVLVAAGLVVAAIAIRSAIDDHGSSSTSTAATPTSSVVTGIDVWCLEDLRAACEAAFGRASGLPVNLAVMTMGDAIARLASAQVADDLPTAWITFAPLPDMAKDAVARAGGPAAEVATSTTLLATTQLVVATRADRAAVLPSVCGAATIDWKCLGQVAGKKWADFGGPTSFQAIKPAFGDPTRSATALMVWAAAVGQYLGRTTYSINDVQADDAFTAWGRNLRAADPANGSGDPLAELVLSRVQRDVAGGTAAAASKLAGLTLVGTPGPHVDLVVAGFAGASLSDPLLAALREALVAQGWTAADATTVAAARPSFTTYVALQNTWKELG